MGAGAGSYLRGDGWIACIIAVAITSVLLGMRPSVTQGVDYQLMHQFYKFYLHSSVRTGEMPLWNPYTALGRPFLADPEAEVFYPPNWVFLMGAGMPALFLFLAFHFWLAGFFFIKLARTWAVPRPAAIAFALVFLTSGPLLGRLLGGALDYFCGLCYWPLLFWLGEKIRVRMAWRYFMALVLAVSGCFLSGQIQCFYLTGLALTVYLTGVHLGSPWRETAWQGLKCLGTLASAYIFALLLCAVQLLPTLDLMLQGNRAGPSLEFAASSPLDWNWITSLFISQPVCPTATWWDANLYIGAIPTVAGLLGLSRWRDPRGRALGLLGGVGFLLSLGQHTPLFAAVLQVCPWMGLFRVAARYATFLSWALLLAALVAWGKGSFDRLRILSLCCVLLAGAAYVAWSDDLYRHTALIDSGWWTGAAVAIMIMVRPQRIRLPVAAVSLLLTLLGIDACVAARQTWMSYRNFLRGRHAEEQVTDLLKQRGLYSANGVPPRVFIPGSILRADSGMKYGFSSVAGYGALTSMRIWTYLHIGAGLPVDFFQDTYLPNEAYRAGPFPFPGMNILIGGMEGSLKLFSNPHPGERAWLVYASEPVSDWMSALPRLIKPGFDPFSTALLEAPAQAQVFSAKGQGEVQIDAFRRNAIEFHVHSSLPALLVIAEAWYPGWHATVNGQKTEVWPANVWMRAVRVGAGNSTVRLYYLEPSLARGAAISGGAMLVLITLGLLWRRRERAATMVPGTGLEPARPCGQGILSPQRLPFRHPGEGR